MKYLITHSFVPLLAAMLGDYGLGVGAIEDYSFTRCKPPVNQANDPTSTSKDWTPVIMRHLSGKPKVDTITAYT